MISTSTGAEAIEQYAQNILQYYRLAYIYHQNQLVNVYGRYISLTTRCRAELQEKANFR